MASVWYFLHLLLAVGDPVNGIVVVDPRGVFRPHLDRLLGASFGEPGAYSCGGAQNEQQGVPRDSAVPETVR